MVDNGAAQQNAIELNEYSSNNSKRTVTGLVYQEGGYHGLSGARVQLYDPSLRKILMTTNTDKSGRYTFTDVTIEDCIINITYYHYYERLVYVSVKEGINEVDGQQLKSRDIYYNSTLSQVLNKFPIVASRYIVFTVCELLRLEPIQAINGFEVIILGNYVHTQEGSWLEQSCGNQVKSDFHVWPDAIFLNNDYAFQKSGVFQLVTNSGNIDSEVRELLYKTMSKDLIEKYKEMFDFESILKETESKFAKDLFQKNIHGDNSSAAVIGTININDSKIFGKCKEEKICAWGYGPVGAPLQIYYDKISHLNQQDKNIDK